MAIIWSSIVKETMKRKRPSFSESAHGYRSFSGLLEDAQKRGFIQLRRDERSGSYIVVDYGRQTTNGEEPREKLREKPPKRARRSSAPKSTAKAKRSTDTGRAPVPKQKKPTAKRSTVGGMRRPQKKTSADEGISGDSPEESS